jgi:hypothetical protein
MSFANRTRSTVGKWHEPPPTTQRGTDSVASHDLVNGRPERPQKAAETAPPRRDADRGVVVVQAHGQVGCSRSPLSAVGRLGKLQERDGAGVHHACVLGSGARGRRMGCGVQFDEDGEPDGAVVSLRHACSRYRRAQPSREGRRCSDGRSR